MAAAGKQWVVGEDGCLSIGEPATSVSYHSSLNSIILTTNESCVKILDATSGIVLQKSDLSARKGGSLKCVYLGEKDKTVFCDGYAIGVRRDLRGVLLLDTALQIPVHKSESLVKCEVPLADATQLFKALVNADLPGVDFVEDVLKELERGIELAQDTTKGNHKMAKWATVCLHLPHLALKTVCSSLVNEMKRANHHAPGLAIASAISDRLGYLLPAALPEVSSNTVDRALMYSEAARRDTFTMWPHMNYKWALPDPMAQAGFYHQPNVSGDDRAMCFTCNVCLVCWEPTDEPWSEHERHSPNCPFVKGEYTQNVPLSVTYATQPAQLHSAVQEKIHCVSSTSNEDFIATSTLDGNVVVWSISHVMKKHCQFILDPSDTLVALKTGVQFDKSRESCSEEFVSVKEEPGGSDTSCSKVNSDVEMKSVSSECCGQTSEEKIVDVPVHKEIHPKGSSSEDRGRVRARPSNDVLVTTLCVLDKPGESKSPVSSGDAGKAGATRDPAQRSCLNPALLCGVSLRRTACRLLEVNEADAAQAGLRNETEQLMNVVNEVVSGETSPHIIPDVGESSSSSNFLAPGTVMIPHLLVVAIQHPPPTPVRKKKEGKGGEEIVPKPNVGLENGMLTPLGQSPMSSDWLNFIDDPFEDDDLQIVGFTPGHAPPLPPFPNIIPENVLGTSPKNLAESTNGSTSHQPQGPLSDAKDPGRLSSSPKTGAIVQCVEFPADLAQDFLEVQSLNTSVDKQFVIVVLAPRAASSACDSGSEERVGAGAPCEGGAILVYRLRREGGGGLLEETPCGVYRIESGSQAVRSLLVLPQEVADQVEEEDSGKLPSPPSQLLSSQTCLPLAPTGQVAVTLTSGKVAILDLADMKVMAKIEPVENDSIVSLSYCTGIERLCACTSGGKLHFYQISEHNADVLDGPLGLDQPSSRTDLSDDLHASKRPKMDDGSEATFVKTGPGPEFLARKALSPESLTALHSLTKFENLMPRFTATVPPCWSEIQQEQQQRRHPQHLQQQGEATRHTRTWKLTADSTTWDEHLFEVVLPRPCCVGHVDLKFSLVSGCSSAPNIEVTLLKQNIGNIHKQAQNSPIKTGVDVDKKVEFNVEGAGASSSMGGREVNNVLDPAFLENHNAEILCGPVRLSSCLDLSNSSGLISLTSPQLLNSKPRSLLLHIKGFPNKADPEAEAKESKKKAGGGAAASASSSDKQKKTIKSLFQDVPTVYLGSSASERLAATAPKPRPLDVKGCDWLQEVSITVRKMKRTSLPRERQQRNAMIELQAFHERLLRVAGNPHLAELGGVSAEHAQNLALEILSWVAAIQMNDPLRRLGGKCIIWSVQHYLRDLVKACFIDGTRTTAHKCARLLALCEEYAKLTADADAAATFSYDLLQALLDCLPMLPSIFSAGALKWYFTLLNRAKCMDLPTVAHRCTDMLTGIARQYNERSSPVHALLKARYGLYGHPFEPDLFDIEPPGTLKQMTPQSSYASVVKTTSTATSTAASGQVGEEPDLFEALGSSAGDRGKSQSEYAKNHILGLLEVEPLHFICHATSDGTRVERMDALGSASSMSSVPSVPLGMTGTINFGENAPPSIVGIPVPMATPSAPLPGMPMADSLKKLAQMYAKQLHPSSKLIEQAINEAVTGPSKVKMFGTPELFPPTPKSTPQLMTPTVTPPNEYHYSVVGPPMKVPNLGFENTITKQSQQQQPSTSSQTSSAFSQIPPAPPLTSPQQGAPHKAAFTFPPTQALLQNPPPQVLVIERMHSGARRFVTLDFGKPILLTDVIIPACGDLASLSIDVWIQGEEVDGQRLVVASDIGTCTLVMNNIMPAPICRYLKITTVGRYGTGTTRSRIPIGAFYGHSYILPWEWQEYSEEQVEAGAGTSASSGSSGAASVGSLGQLEVGSHAQLLSQLSIFISLQEDLQCRYSLARTRLQSLLAAADSSQFATAHIQYYLSKNKKKEEDNSILQAYGDCLGLQLQVNLAQRAIWRLQRALGLRPSPVAEGLPLATSLRATPTDKLRALLEALLDTLLALTPPGRASLPRPPTALYQGLTSAVAEGLFKNLCLLGSKKIQISTGLLLVRVCGSQAWWGDFLGNMLQEFFHSEFHQVFPQDRVFLLLCTLGQRSLSGPSSVAIMESLLGMLAKVLSPLSTPSAPLDGPGSNSGGRLDISLISWILLFLCRNFDNSSATSFISDDSDKSSKKDKDNGPCLTNRWGFIQGSRVAPAKSKGRNSKLHRRLMQRRLLHHKQKLQDLEKAKKKIIQANKDPDFPFSLHNQAMKEFDQYASKGAVFQHLKDLVAMRKNEVEMLRRMREDSPASPKERPVEDMEAECPLVLPRERCLAVVHGLMALLLGMDFTCHVDLFLVACKVLARICSAARPAISLAEAMSQEQLEKLILLATGQSHPHSTSNWGGPWASHAITCLLQDILDGERLFPTAVGLPGLSYEEMSAISETDESLMPSPGDLVDSCVDMTEDSMSMKEADSMMKDSSLMVDMLLEENDMDDDITDKLHEYVTGESVKPPTIDGPFHVAYMPSLMDKENDILTHYPCQEILEKKKKMKSLRSRLSDFLNSPKPSSTQGLSTALDARLELGLETRPELRLRVMMSVHMEMVQSAFTSPLPSPPSLPHSHSASQFPPTDEELYESALAGHRVETSNQMLSQCFQHLFSRLMSGSIRLDPLLQLWLMLVEDGEEQAQPSSFDCTRCPSLPLTHTSLSHLMEFVTFSSTLSVRSWVFVFQTLALLANQRSGGSEEVPDTPLVGTILSNPHFTPLLLKFLRTAPPTFGGVHHAQVGPSATRAFDDFLRRLQVKSGEDNIQILKELMLKIVYTLTTESGAFFQGTGALDAQCKFLDFVLDIRFCQVDIGNAMSVIESISTLIHHFIVHQERVSCRSSLENNRINARSCFSGLFAQLLRGGDSKNGSGDCSPDTLMCSLLKLVNRIIKVANPNLPSGQRRPPPPSVFNQPPSLDEDDEESSFNKLLPSSPLMMSDDAKGQQTDEEKTETAAAVAASDIELLEWRGGAEERPGPEGGSPMADIILGHRLIMQKLLQSLGCCNSHTMATLITNANMATTNMSQSVASSDSQSVGDWVYQILVTLSTRCSDPRLMLEALFQHLSGGLQGSQTLCRLSEPLLWFTVKVLEQSQAIQLFLEMGGIKVLCDNLVSCSHRMVSTAPSLISTIMENFNSGVNTSADRSLNIDADLTDGLQNFAPLGSITCASPTATPADVLIQASPPHRRARSATWSYHFYPNEHWVDLTIHLPFAILLREVQIQPHNTALATCPAFVSLEISHDGTVVTPLSPPLLTSSLACIKLQLQNLEVATLITVRLHKARDSSTIGLHQMFVLGYPTFWDAGSRGVSIGGPSTSPEDHITRISISWMQLLHHCLTAHSEITNTVAAAAAPTPNLVNTCTSILVSSATAIYCPKIQEVLLRMGLFSRQMGLELIDNLLRSPTYTNAMGGTSSYLGKVSGMANEWTVEILYQLGTVNDEALGARVQALVQWLGDSARVALQRSATYSSEGFGATTYPCLPNPAPPHVHCVAAVLWQGQEASTAQAFRHVINRELVSSLYEWSTVLEQDSLLKRAVDYVLCACCHINPEYFTLLLEWMGIVASADRSLTASISDDRKDIFHPTASALQVSQTATLTDDSKEANRKFPGQSSPCMLLVDFRHMVLDEARLSALAVICKSPVALRLLVDSGFPAVLAQSLLEFCSRHMAQTLDHLDHPLHSPPQQARQAEKNLCITPELMAAILNFFADIGSEGTMKDWLGGPEGNIFWPSLLSMLCNTPTQRPSLFAHHPSQHRMMTVENRDAIETATVRFFTSVITCHSENQLLFAKVLCDIVREQGTCKAGALVSGIPLSGFTRRILLQVLLEDEKILVAFTTGSESARNTMNHPRYGAGRRFCTRTVSLNSTCGELVKQFQDSTSFTTLQLKPEDDKKKAEESKKECSAYQVVEILSNAAGLSAQEKREKSPAAGKPSLPPRPPTRRGRPTLSDDLSASCKSSSFVLLRLHPHVIPNNVLPVDLTLSQILMLLHQRGALTGDSALEFIFDSDKQKAKMFGASTTPAASAAPSGSAGGGGGERRDERDGDIPDEVLLALASFPSALQVFASAGGLALLAEHLPLLYPEITRQAAAAETPATDNNNVGDFAQDWVTVESSDEFYDPYVEPVSPAPSSSRAGRHPPGSMPTIPPHSLIAFGLFLRLPGYAEVLLKERKKAQCLLRLVLGVTDDGDGGHILTSPIASSLPTLPFTVLKTLLDASPLTTDDGVVLRRMGLDIGVVHLLLACLSVLSHQAPRVSVAGFQHETQLILTAMQAATNQSSLTPTSEKTQHYWAKGTGFGTGSTTSSWDAEQALLRQRSEEEHVTCLLQVLASYINPGGSAATELGSDSYVGAGGESGAVPEVVGELLSQSCLVPAISSYLRNDSVLDMARHVPLYRALLELLRALASVPALVALLCPMEQPPAMPPSSVQILLEKMKGCVDTYANRLKANKGKNGGSKLEEEENEGLALLIPDIQETARIVRSATDRHRDAEDIPDCGSGHAQSGDAHRPVRSMEERYSSAMKELQFDTFEMVTSEGATLKFLVGHHFESNVKAAGEINNAARTRRLAQEAVTLSTSLPLSASSSVFVRCDDERLDIMKVLITGPADTPYANGCFEFDVYFPQDYPNSPPSINLETTGNHSIRFNPNLYNDGKVCLSVLNTWHGRPEEKWNSQTSSFLQVLVSIQSLILVSEPYFNEPGYERSRGTPSGTASSRDYDSNIRQATVKWAMLEQLRNPSPCLKEVIQRHFWLKRHEVLKQCEDWIAEMESYCNDKRTGRSIAHSTLALKRHYNSLREELAKMKPPEDLEEEDGDTIDPAAKRYSTEQATGGAAAGSPADKEVAGPSGLPPISQASMGFLDPLGLGQDLANPPLEW